MAQDCLSEPLSIFEGLSPLPPNSWELAFIAWCEPSSSPRALPEVWLSVGHGRLKGQSPLSLEDSNLGSNTGQTYRLRKVILARQK